MASDTVARSCSGNSSRSGPTAPSVAMGWSRRPPASTCSRLVAGFVPGPELRHARLNDVSTAQYLATAQVLTRQWLTAAGGGDAEELAALWCAASLADERSLGDEPGS